MTERNEKLKNLIGYLSANKIDNRAGVGGREESKESTEQVKE